MKKTVIFTCLLLALSLAGAASAAVLIDLDASGLPEGQLETWPNAGTAGGVFSSAESHMNSDNEVVPDPNAVVEIVDGVKAVSFADGAWMVSDIPGPNEISADNPWSILIWSYAPTTTGEDCLFQWADRGGDTQANTAHFNFGSRAMTNFFDDVFYTNNPPTSEWVHLAMTYDGTDVKLYINGIDDTVAPRSLSIAEGHTMHIARALPDLWGTHPFAGSIASIQVHDTALTNTEIQTIAGVFEAGILSPADLSIMEGNGSKDISVQIYMNPLTSAGPTSDLEVTLSFAGAYTDAQLGTSAVGDPYVITVPAATYSDPILVSIVAEDDAILEGTHSVLVKGVVTSGDPDYVGLSLTPLGGLPVTVVDNDFAPCPPPAFADGAYIDEFDCLWDFNLGATGFWDGFMNAGNASSANTVVTSGKLHFESTGNWGGAEADGPFLYTEVTGDFVAEIHMDPPTANGPNNGGLMVRLADPAAGGAGEDNMILGWMPSWDVGSIFWPTDNNDRPEWDITWEGASAHSYLRVERRGAAFYWSRSYDGVTWDVLPSASPIVREDMDVATLQVGVYQSFGTGADDAIVEYDYFKLTPPRGTLTGTLNLTESTGDTGTVQFQLDMTNAPMPLADIDVTISAVATAGADPNSDPNDVLIETSAMGEPYTFTIPAASSDQPQSIGITAMVDAYDEPDQQLTLVADIATTDPNWNGTLIVSDVEINILETPGLLLDIGDGVTAAEGGADGTFTVRLKIPPLAPVTVDIADDTDPDQVVATTPLSFDGSTWMTPQAVTVAAVDDAVLETDPHATTLTLTATNGSEYDTLAPTIVDVSILENECGAWGYLWADFDADCDVDLGDLSEMATVWLDCSNPYDVGCIDMR